MPRWPRGKRAQVRHGCVERAQPVQYVHQDVRHAFVVSVAEATIASTANAIPKGATHAERVHSAWSCCWSIHARRRRERRRDEREGGADAHHVRTWRSGRRWSFQVGGQRVEATCVHVCVCTRARLGSMERAAALTQDSSAASQIMEDDRMEFDHGAYMVWASSTDIKDARIRRRGRGFGANDSSEPDGVKSQGFEQLDVEMDKVDDDDGVKERFNETKAVRCMSYFLCESMY